MDLQLTAGDLALVNGDLVLVDGLAAIAQDVSTRLQMFKGEWFLNTDDGIPYYEKILVKNPSIPDVIAILSKVILSTPGVNSLTQGPSWSYNGATRAMTISFKANTIAGPLTYTQELIL
jgi:hypothetical protein